MHEPNHLQNRFYSLSLTDTQIHFHTSYRQFTGQFDFIELHASGCCTQFPRINIQICVFMLYVRGRSPTRTWRVFPLFFLVTHSFSRSHVQPHSAPYVRIRMIQSKMCASNIYTSAKIHSTGVYKTHTHIVPPLILPPSCHCFNVKEKINSSIGRVLYRNLLIFIASSY